MSPGRHARRVLRTAILVLGFLAAPTFGPVPALGQELFTPNYRETDLLQVIDAVSAVTGRNFLPDARVRGAVTLISNTPMTRDEFYQAFLATLAVHGFVAVDEGAVTKIIPDANARQVPAGGGLDGEGEQLVTRVVRVENVQAAQIIPMLRPMQPQYAHMAALAGGRTLVIVDRASNVDRLVEVIAAMDQEADDDFEVIRLENAFAGDVVQTLGSITQAAQAAGAAPPVTAFADERTNAIVLGGSQTGRLRYRGLIAMLDEPTQDGGTTQVRYLNYADAEELATQLQAQFSGAAATPAEGAPPQEAGPISIWANAGTNALVLNAPARVLQDMLSIIDQIDIPRAQVQVRAIIVEMTEDKAAQLGVTWIVADEDDAPLALTNFGATTRGVAQLGAAAQGDTPSINVIPDGILAGVGRITDSGTSWAALMSALQGDGSANIIGRPNITVLDNEEAEISVGQEVPFLTGQFTNTGASDGAINPFQTIQREEVGTRLLITPQINEGTGMTLTIEQEQSSISPGSGGAVDLITNNRTITTSVFAEDGEILVLGGLIDDQVRQNEQRVPVLGRIPGLGWLFRARSTERVRTNLMVFIQPTILRDSIQASSVTSEKYNYIRQQQLQQAERPIRLMRDEEYPVLPEFPPPRTPLEPPPGALDSDLPPEILNDDALDDGLDDGSLQNDPLGNGGAGRNDGAAR